MSRSSSARTFARRLHGWSWQAFPIGMGTGAVYVTLSALREQSSALRTVQLVFFFLNVALFILNTSTLALQALLYPRQALRQIRDPVKGIFVPLVVLSFATIIIGLVIYAYPAGKIGSELIYRLFWLYVAFALACSFPMLMIWFNQPHELKGFTPAYAFLIFPMMLVGVVAFTVLSVIDVHDPRGIGVLLVGYFFQGIGFFVTFMFLGIYILRIMTTGFLHGHQANGAFVACGPPGFTALALVRLGKEAQRRLPQFGLVGPTAGDVWYATSVMGALMLLGLAVFFFFFGLMPYVLKFHSKLRDILGCWALTFPNVGWINTIRTLADIFHIEGFYTVHLVMTILLCITWLTLMILTLLAFYRGLIFCDRDEDVEKDEIHPDLLHSEGGSVNWRKIFRERGQPQDPEKAVVGQRRISDIPSSSDDRHTIPT
ncbi:voltage-dependent anion channel-domain-containing protein [Flagelloscypha sp. PMI_526]|nr:voltage-dependent anion channel-domain-containing protein [Flagelloscypha sp. PMI_526]